MTGQKKIPASVLTGPITKTSETMDVVMGEDIRGGGRGWMRVRAGVTWACTNMM